MRWLLDQGIPRSAGSRLCDAGHDATHVGDLGMAASTDLDIMEYALREKRIIVTFDADFHSILARQGTDQPSVIRIREEGLKGNVIEKLLLHIANRFAAELLNGCLMSYQNQKIRLRKLPVS